MGSIICLSYCYDAVGGNDLAANIREEFCRQNKILKFVADEVVIQHRLRMDIWTPSKRTREEQQEFKASLNAFYECQHESDPNLLQCMVVRDFFPREKIIASHIWKSCTHGVGLEEFGLDANDVSNPRNGILMCQDIEKAFDSKQLCFLIDRIRSDNIVLKVLNPALLDVQVIPGLSSLTFRDVDGRSLKHPESNLPFRRILNFHSKLSYKNAIARKWIPNDATFTDFFAMSINASIPDLDVYQHIFEDDDA